MPAHEIYVKRGKMMYANPFWLGVLVTIVAELVAMIVYAAVRGEKKRFMSPLQWQRYSG